MIHFDSITWLFFLFLIPPERRELSSCWLKWKAFFQNHLRLGSRTGLLPDTPLGHSMMDLTREPTRSLEPSIYHIIWSLTWWLQPIPSSGRCGEKCKVWFTRSAVMWWLVLVLIRDCSLRRSPLWRTGWVAKPAYHYCQPSSASPGTTETNHLAWIDISFQFVFHHFWVKRPRLILLRRVERLCCVCEVWERWQPEHSTLRTVQLSTHTITAYHCTHKILNTKTSPQPGYCRYRTFYTDIFPLTFSVTAIWLNFEISK